MKQDYPDYSDTTGKIQESLRQNLNKSDKEVLERLQNYSRLNAGEDKVKQRTRYMLQFRDIAEVSFNKFNRKVIEGIYLLIKKTNREPIGKNEVIKNLRYDIRFLFPDQHTELLKNIKLIKVKDGINGKKINAETLITETEAEKLINSCTDIKQKAMITLFLESGIRPCELLNLKWNECSFEDKFCKIKINSTKTGTTRVIVVKNCIPFLTDWKENTPNKNHNDWVFPNPKNPQDKLNNHYLTLFFIRLCKKAGIRNIFPYLARHTKLTQMYKKLPSPVVQSFAGHGSGMSEVYCHLNENDIVQEVLEKMYNVKALSREDKTKLEKDMDKLKQIIQVLMNDLGYDTELSREYFKMKIGLQTKQDMERNIENSIK